MEAVFARRSWRALGTSVDLVVTDPDALDQSCAILECELDRIDRIASRFRLDSELSILNQTGGRDCPISAGLAEALFIALRSAELTDGLVDPTIGGALVSAGYDRDFALVDLDGPHISLHERPSPGWRSVHLDTAGGRVRIPANTAIDLGATAKALAADRSAHQIAHATNCGVAVALGGDIAVAGPTPPKGWSVSIAEDLGRVVPTGPVRHNAARTRRSGPAGPVRGNADNHPGSDCTVSIDGGGVATSGTTIRQWRRGTAALHHIIDPFTGLPATSCWRTATVAAGTCVDANTASTAAILLCEGAVAWLEARMLPARLIDVNGGVTVVAGWPGEPSSSNTARSARGRKLTGSLRC